MYLVYSEIKEKNGGNLPVLTLHSVLSMEYCRQTSTTAKNRRRSIGLDFCRLDLCNNSLLVFRLLIDYCDLLTETGCSIVKPESKAQTQVQQSS